jgi:hypothetical protein
MKVSLKWLLGVSAWLLLVLSVVACGEASPTVSPLPTVSPVARPEPGGAVPAQETGSIGEAELVMIQKALLVLIEVATPPVVAWLLIEWKRWRAQMQQHAAWDTLEWVVKDVVRAAEQLDLTGDLSRYAEDKLSYAMRRAEELLAARGLPLDVDAPMDLLRTLIEAEVNRQFPPQPSE